MARHGLARGHPVKTEQQWVWVRKGWRLQGLTCFVWPSFKQINVLLGGRGAVQVRFLTRFSTKIHQLLTGASESSLRIKSFKLSSKNAGYITKSVEA